jgi:quercetin dioxygenase-like cupin family protein
LPAGWPGDVDDPHVSPAPNYWIVLSGEIEITVGDGEARRFSQGSILLAEDTTGEGHVTTVVSESPPQFAVVEKSD